MIGGSLEFLNAVAASCTDVEIKPPVGPMVVMDVADGMNFHRREAERGAYWCRRYGSAIRLM